MRAAIIADDLTGACDAAARAALAGWRVRVLLKGPLEGHDLSVVSTATRNHTPEQAGKAVAEAARALITRGIRPLFKKIDSTLRGPWAAEVAAQWQVTGAQVVAVCPAFPACGRIVRNGVVSCGGEAVGALAPALEAAGVAGDEVSVMIGNAETDADLADFVHSVAARGRSVLWVGSAGLARFAFGQGDYPGEPRPNAARWLVAAGSTHPATLDQVEAARAAGIEVVSQIPDAFAPGASTGLFLIGGDTAERAVRHLEADALEVLGEVLPGVAVGRLLGGRADGVPFLSKAGGFGRPDTVVRAISLCRPQNQATAAGARS